MRPGAFLRCATWTVVPVIAFLFAACGSDKAAPTDPATTSTIPDIVFFNTNDLSNVVLFEGRATDNTRVEEVLISFDNGAADLFINGSLLIAGLPGFSAGSCKRSARRCLVRS